MPDNAHALVNLIDAPTGGVHRIAKVALGVLDTGGGVFSWANPESVAILVDKVLIDVTTKSTGACTIDVGMTAASATTKVDNLLDGIDVGTATGLLALADQAGVNGLTRQKVAVGKWVTGSQDSGASAGLVGFAYIYYSLA
jgi:hypothetical protein